MEEALRWLPDPKNRPITTEENPDNQTAQFSLRVLLADDNADMRAYVTGLLRRYWTVEEASDGAAALALALAHPPDLLLSDVMMPGLDGFRLLREFRKDTRLRDIPVVLLSARAGEESKLEGLAAGADDYLIKPFSAKELLARQDPSRCPGSGGCPCGRNQLRMIANAMPALISYVDLQRRYVFNNKAYEVWFGCPSETVLGKHMSEILGKPPTRRSGPI